MIPYVPTHFNINEHFNEHQATTSYNEVAFVNQRIAAHRK